MLKIPTHRPGIHKRHQKYLLRLKQVRVHRHLRRPVKTRPPAARQSARIRLANAVAGKTPNRAGPPNRKALVRGINIIPIRPADSESSAQLPHNVNRTPQNPLVILMQVGKTVILQVQHRQNHPTRRANPLTPSRRHRPVPRVIRQSALHQQRVQPLGAGPSRLPRTIARTVKLRIRRKVVVHQNVVVDQPQ